jgi:hypothetical protein
VAVTEELSVGKLVRVGVLVSVCVTEDDVVGEGVSDAVPVCVPDSEPVLLWEGVPLWLPVTDGVEVVDGVSVELGVPVCVVESVAVTEGVPVIVCVLDCVPLPEGVPVVVGVDVPVADGNGVRVAVPALSWNKKAQRIFSHARTCLLQKACPTSKV